MKLATATSTTLAMLSWVFSPWKNDLCLNWIALNTKTYWVIKHLLIRSKAKLLKATGLGGQIWHHLVNSSQFMQLAQEEMNVNIKLKSDLVIVTQSWLGLSRLLPLTHLQLNKSITSSDKNNAHIFLLCKLSTFFSFLKLSSILATLPNTSLTC